MVTSLVLIIGLHMVTSQVLIMVTYFFVNGITVLPPTPPPSSRERLLAASARLESTSVVSFC